MLNEQNITDICKEICGKAGYNFTIPVKINKRLTRTLGRVTFFQRFDGYTTNSLMEISYQLLTTATEESILEVIAHECAHYLVIEETHENHGHDAVFKAMCARINCTNDGTHYNELKHTAPEEEVYKYFVICEDCKKIVSRYHRAGKVVQHPEQYQCKCGGRLHVIKNFQEENHMIHKNRGNRRKMNYKKALRKARIIKDHHDYWSYNSLNELSKNKIHCSCPMCKAKTNNKMNKSHGPVDPKRRFCRLACTNYRYGRKYWKPSDKKKIDNMNYMTDIYLNENNQAILQKVVEITAPCLSDIKGVADVVYVS